MPSVFFFDLVIIFTMESPKITVVAKLQFLTDDVDVDILIMIWDWKRSRS